MSTQVLLIDDDPIIRHLARGLLTPAGYVVREAADGPEGIRAARLEHPDIILLDLQLPSLDGYAVCTQLKADPATQNIPIIVLTASTDRSLHGQITRAGAAACIPKPFRREALLSTLALCVNQGKHTSRPVPLGHTPVPGPKG